MAANKHIEQIGDTDANIRGNLDSLQLAIQTDDIETFVWADEGADKYFYAARQYSKVAGGAITYLDNEFNKITLHGNLIIPDAGNIGSVSDTDAMAIGAGGIVTFSAGLNNSGASLLIQDDAAQDVELFASAAGGETPTFQISGFRNVDAQRTLTIGVSGAVNDALEFKGLSDYIFDGDLNIPAGGEIGCTGDFDLMTLNIGALTLAGTLGCDTITVTANSDIDLSGTGKITSGSEGFIVGTLTITDGSIDDTDGSIAFSATNFTGVGTVGCGALTSTGALADGAASTFTTGATIGNLTLADGSITDSSGAITFNDENLLTTGTFGAGVITGTSFITASNIGISGDTDLIQLTAANTMLVNGTGQFVDIGIGTAPGTYKLTILPASNEPGAINITDTTFSSTADYIGVLHNVVKTAGASNVNDTYYAARFVMGINQPGATVSSVIGLIGAASITNGTIGASRDLIGLQFAAETFTGTSVGRNLQGLKVTALNRVGATVTGDLAGAHIIATQSGTNSGTAYGVYLADTGLDFGYYQTGSAENRFGGVVNSVLGFEDNGTPGIDDTFTNGDGDTVTVSGGIITSIV